MPRHARRWLPSAAVLVSLVVCSAAPPLAAQTDRQRHVTVTVLGRNETPVTGLTAADFTVREDDMVREIVSVTPGVLPDHVVLLVDDTQATTSLVAYVRDGLQAFVQALADHAGPPEIRLTTFGDRPTVRADFTTSVQTLVRAAERIFPQAGAGSTLLEAIVETCRDLRGRHVEHAAIVVFVADAGPEMTDENHARVADAVKASGASLWAIVRHDANNEDTSSRGRERAIVLGDVTRDSGGLDKTIIGDQGIAPAFGQVAAALASAYDITYGRPDRLIPPSRLSVAARDATQRVLVRRWPAE
jgi:von Willebrand factor type A domain